MPKPKERHVPRPTSAPRPGEVARARPRPSTVPNRRPLAHRRSNPSRMRLEEFLRSYLPRGIDAAGSLPRSASSSCSRTCCSVASRSTASANGRRGTLPMHSGSPIPNYHPQRRPRRALLIGCSARCPLAGLGRGDARRQGVPVALDELHNDSTTVTFYGAYADAAEEGKRGRPTWPSPSATTRTIVPT